MNTWLDKKNIIGLAPMDGYTDAPFRYLIASIAKPDVIFTEFVNVDGIVVAFKRLQEDFVYDEIERPIIAQLFGSKPENFYKATKTVIDMGFDGVDINMGCPQKKVVKRSEGAGLIKNPELAKEIVMAVKKAISESNRKITLSIKTRTGYEVPITREWISTLASTKPDLITLHGRTLKQMYSGVADWEEIKIANGICKKNGVKFFGNGDIESIDEANEKIKKYDLDGVLIGRAVFGNPWLFCAEQKLITKNQKLKMCLIHTKIQMKIFPNKSFIAMRKHFAAYINSFDFARDLRIKVLQANTYEEVERIINEELENEDEK
jgi:nifR3 family TIM-barrel protein